ncbi:MAG: tetratricopeptide repeat protein [Bacteroidota bacterium]
MKNKIKHLLIAFSILCLPILSFAQSEEAKKALDEGKALSNKGEYDKAIASFTEAIRLYPDYASAYNYRGYYYYINKEYVKSIADLNQAIKLDPKYGNAHYNLGVSYYYNEDYTNSIGSFTEAIKISPTDSLTYNWRGFVYTKMEEYDIATADLKKAISLSTKFLAAYNNLANISVLKNDIDDAIKQYQDLILLEPTYRAAYEKLGNIYKNREQYELALNTFNELVRLDPKIYSGYSNRASVYAAQRNFEKAAAEYSKFLKVEPSNTSALSSRSTAYVNQKLFVLALADANELVRLNPKMASYYSKRGEIYRQMGERDLAIKDYDEMISLAPTVTSYRNRAQFYEKLKENDLALKDFETGINMNQKSTYGYLQRAHFYRRKHQYTLAIADLEKAEAISPNSSVVFDTHFWVAKESGNYQSAIDFEDRVVKLDPQKKGIAVEYVSPYFRLGMVDKATEYARQVLKKEFISFPFYKNYVEVIAFEIPERKYTEALIKIDKGLKEQSELDKETDTQSEYLDLLALKGYVFAKMGRNAEAKQVYEQALLINPLQPDVKAAILSLQTKTNVIASADKLPPTIQLISPQTSRGLQVVTTGSKTEIIGRAKDPSGIASVNINGISVAKIEDDGMFVSSAVLKPGLNTIIIVATDKKGNIATKSFPVTGNVETPAVIAQKKEVEIIMPVAKDKQPVYHAVLIAANDYEDASIQDLENPIKDAKELEGILETSYTFQKDHIETLYNKSREEIMQALVQKSSSMGENDNLLIFYAGHGIAEKDKFGDVDGYWIPSSAKKGLNASYISADDINKALKRSDAKHILVIADACFSGAFTRSMSDASIGIQKQYSVPSRKIMASGNMEPVPDNSKFIFYLKKNLKSNTARYLTAKKLFDSFYEAILNNSDTSPQYAAIKNVGDEGGQFVFIKK